MARVNEQWQFTYANHKAEGLFRHPREELLGRVTWEVFPESVGTVFQNNYEQALADRTPTIFEAFSDLLGLWLEVAAYPSDEGLAVYLRDVTEHREVCGALVESEERYRLLFESSADAIFHTESVEDVYRALCGDLLKAQLHAKRRQTYLRRERESHSRPMPLSSTWDKCSDPSGSFVQMEPVGGGSKAPASRAANICWSPAQP
jgi:PAS domain-containing protein